ncbi:MAG: hypothetical protein QXU18_04775 [Thermoplasmatales archaeon]
MNVILSSIRSNLPGLIPECQKTAVRRGGWFKGRYSLSMILTAKAWQEGRSIFHRNVTYKQLYYSWDFALY